MAEEVEMTPVEAAEPPKANPPAIHKPVAGVAPAAAPKPGLKLPTQPALKPGIRLPPKPMIRKPGATVTAKPLPKPLPKPVAPAAAAPAAAPAAAAPAEAPKPLDTLKTVTQKMKGVTQEIPQQAILRKTGIIADAAMSEAQKEASKHKTSRIALSDAIGVAPVKEENAPMKTIKIKRPTGIPGATSPLTPQPAAAPAQTGADAAEPASTVTQRKTLKISRPGGAVRPAGKFGVKRPGAPAAAAAPAEAPVGDIADIPEMPTIAPVPMAAKPVSEGPAWLWTLSALVQIAACVAIGVLGYMLYENWTTNYF